MDTEIDSISGRRVLITGGLGFIGSNLAHKCLELGAEVTIYDCLDPHSGGNMYNVDGIRNDIRLILHDILNFDQVSQHIVGHDIIFNCAASTSHPFSMREPWVDMDVNVKGIINLLEAIRRFNPDARLIHLGTSTQLGKLDYSPADEKHPEFPTDIYSANKTASEKYVLIYAQAHKMKTTTIRLSNIFGPRASIHSPEFTFNNYFVGLALQDKPVTIFGEGRQKRNVLYVDDAVRALVAVAMSSNTIGETLFAVGDHHYSITEIAQKTVKQIGKGSVCHIPWPKKRKAIDVGDAILTNAKLKRRTNWSPEFSLETGLRKTAEYFLPRLDFYLR